MEEMFSYDDNHDDCDKNDGENRVKDEDEERDNADDNDDARCPGTGRRCSANLSTTLSVK